MKADCVDKWWKAISLVVILGMAVWLLVTLWPDILEAFNEGPGLTIFLLCVAGVAVGFFLHRTMASRNGNGGTASVGHPFVLPGQHTVTWPSVFSLRELPPTESVSRVFLIAVGIGVLLLRAAAQIGYAGIRPAAFRISCLWAFAFLSLGFLLGFLFALPPRSAKAGSSNGGQDDTKDPETGLEPIVEWLTKIIVGVSLVEFRVILERFKTTAIFVAQCLSDNSYPSRDTISFAGSFILLFSVLGLLAGYLLTNLYLKEKLSKASRQLRSVKGPVDVAAAVGAIESDADKIRNFWRKDGTVNLDHEKKLLDWIKQNCPGYSITDLIYLEELKGLRTQVVAALQIP
jgi:hypothetical protein